MPPERTLKPRQEPVSCQLCRQRKLKCSRQHPCSNCESRGATCVFPGSQPPPASADLVKTECDVEELAAENAVIKARLSRLEELVLKQFPSDVVRNNFNSPVVSVPTPLSEAGRSYQGDTHYLEGVVTQNQALLLPLHSGLQFHTCSPEELLNRSAAMQSGALQVFFPPADIGIALLNDYCSCLDSVQHIIYAPTVRALLDRLYLNISTGEPNSPGSIALLLSIFASMSLYWSMGFGDRSIFKNSDVATEAASIWAKSTLDVLEYSYHTTSGSIEAVQATVFTLFLLFHLEGLSSRVRLLHASAMTIARDLGLHRIDAQPSTPSSQQEMIEKEVGRRVWWHIAASDWQLANSGGPHEGVYSIQPKHMWVNLPRNVNDEDLTMQPWDFNRQDSEPTEMSYYIQRLKIGEICRIVVDELYSSSDTSNASQQDYAMILSLDRRFETLLEELPWFLRLDRSHRQAASSQIGNGRPQTKLQRHVVNLMIYARRCKLHLPYLGLYHHDSKYAYSRTVCLESARHVLHLRSELLGEHAYGPLAQSRLNCILHHVFYATVVLVMDLCVNRTAGDEKERKAEVRDACKVLEGAAERSAPANVFLESLTSILKKHEIHLPLKFSTTQTAGPAVSRQIPPAGSGSDQMPWLDPTTSADYLADFDNVWESYLKSGTNQDVQGWNELFADLGAGMS